jgi:hypothetical protein
MTEEQSVPAKTTRDYSQYKTKDPSGLHVHMSKWIKDKIGHEVSPKDVQLIVALYADFQSSPERKEAKALEEAQAAKAKAEALAAKAAKGSTRQQQTQKRLQAAAELLKKHGANVELPGQSRGEEIPEGGAVKDETPEQVAAKKTTRKSTSQKVDA